MSLTNQIICCHQHTAEEKHCAGQPIVAPENHIVDDSLVNQVPDFDEAGHRGDQSEHSHDWVGFCALRVYDITSNLQGERETQRKRALLE